MRSLITFFKRLFESLAETPVERRIRRFRSGFTLVELLLVIVIIGLVSVLTLPMILASLSERAVVSGASLLQAAIVGARDRAINAGAPAGIRLLPDPALPGACNRWIETATPPSYSEGLCRIDSGAFPLPLPSPLLVLEQSIRGSDGLLANPTSWFWNLRIGERVHIGTGEYTIVGPQTVPNPEQFVNAGPPGIPSPLNRGAGPVEFLWLVNGRDDDGDGYIDNGYDGITSNFEREQWLTPIAGGIEFATYSVSRRPVPVATGLATALPSSCVIDCTDQTRSRLPLNPDGSCDIVVRPDGTIVPSLIYSSPSSLSMGAAWFHFWLADRGDVGMPPKGDARLLSLNGKTGKLSIFDPADNPNPHVQAQR